MARDITLGSIVKNKVTGAISSTLRRLMGAGLSSDSRLIRAKAKWGGRTDQTDWRVRLTVPIGSPLESFFDFANNPLLNPLVEANGIFWPLTPSMIIQHTANYNAMSQTHSNYPHYAYQNSQVDTMNVIGEFPVQNQQDAKHWVATVNFLRTATKMFFGKDDGNGLKGNPPPILHLYGYGEHMFNKIPVIVNSFNVELRAGIDYISTKQSGVYRKDVDVNNPNHMSKGDDDSQTWAPTISNISVQLSPIYSRDTIKNFSMKRFVNGDLNGTGSNEVGFI
jgi:hypothetical protein|tara:strand:- start:16 stop:852 length:837 start_codon:yes stop_codon:yes gene_type:complete